MGEIKSALEIALEKTADIKSDKTKLRNHDTLQKGKRMASKFLHPDPDADTPPLDLKAELKSIPKEELKFIRQGIFEVVLSSLTLPSEELDVPLLDRAEETLNLLMNNRKQVEYIFKQLNEFLTQYLQNKEQIKQNLEKQYAPRLREKEEALRQKFGSSIELEPSSDPEFLEFLKQNYTELDKKYQEALNQMKEQLRQL